ncbi:MAG: type II secretion system protein GspL [Myxococcota bacterium]
MALLKNVLGLDVGTHNLKAVEVHQTLRGFETVALRTLPRRDDQTPLSELLRRFVALHHLTTDHVVTAVRGDRVSSRQLSLPFGDRKKITAAVPFEVEEQLPFDLEDCLIDWELIRGDRASSDVVASIARRAEVSSVIETLTEAGCAPRTLEAEGLVLANLAALFDLPGTQMLIDLGHVKSTCCVLTDGRAVAARTIPIGGKALTEAIAGDRSLDLESAERAKCEEGVLGSAAGTLTPMTGQVIDRLCREIARTAGSLEQTLAELDAGPIQELTLFGGTAQLDRIEEILTERTRIPAARLGDPIEGHDGNLTAGGSPLSYAPAMALALRGTARARTRTNFLQDEFAVRIDLSRYRRDFGWTATLAGISAALAVVGFATSTLLEIRRADAIEATVNQLFSEVFPGRAVPGNAIATLRQEVRAANDRAVFLGVYPGNLSALDVLSEISRRIPSDLDIVFEELNIDRQTVRMKVYSKTFESADRLGAELAKFAPFARARIGSIENDKKRGGKRFNVTISLASAEDTA